jgi:hypothetical protein
VHAANGHRLSDGRVVILSPWQDDHQRLWQLVKIHPSLRENLSTALEQLPAGELADNIVDAALHLDKARQLLGDAELRVPCRLWTISPETARPPVYLGLMPLPHLELAPDLQGESLVAREFRPFLRSLFELREDAATILNHLVGRARMDATGPCSWLGRLACEFSS